MPQRLLALLLCAALFIPSCTLAEDTTPEPERFVAPTLPPDAIAWDSSHPDILDEDMLYARSAILIEANTGEVLFEKNADEIMYPASTTKIMTAYIALQMGDHGQRHRHRFAKRHRPCSPDLSNHSPFRRRTGASARPDFSHVDSFGQRGRQRHCGVSLRQRRELC